MIEKIHVVSQSTLERNNETKTLFEEVKPFLDDGYGLNYAVRKVKGLNYHGFTRRRWYLDLKEYAKKRGY